MEGNVGIAAIVRPVLARRLWAEAVHQQARHPRVVIDAALLFEWGSERRFDRVVFLIVQAAPAIEPDNGEEDQASQHMEGMHTGHHVKNCTFNAIRWSEGC